MSFLTRISETKTPAGETYRRCREIPTTSGNLLNVCLWKREKCNDRPSAATSTIIYFFLPQVCSFPLSCKALTLTLIANSLSSSNDFSRCLRIFMSRIIAAFKRFSSLTHSHLGTAYCFITKHKMHLLKSLLFQGISGFYNTSATQSSDGVPSGCDEAQDEAMLSPMCAGSCLHWHDMLRIIPQGRRRT